MHESKTELMRRHGIKGQDTTEIKVGNDYASGNVVP